MERSRAFRQSTPTAVANETLVGGERVLLAGTLHMVDGYEARVDLPGVLVGGYDAGSYKIKLAGTDEIVRAPRSAFNVMLDDAQPVTTDDNDDAPSDLERVGAYLNQLNLDGKLNNFTASLHDQWTRHGRLSERQVAAVMKDVAKAEARQEQPRESTPAVTQPGVYEKDGIVYVVKFNKEKTALYAKQIRELNSTRITEAGTVVEIEFDYVAGAVYRLTPDDKMPLDRAKEYTIRYGRCIVCGRDLKKAESVERGIGPVCIKSFA